MAAHLLPNIIAQARQGNLASLLFLLTRPFFIVAIIVALVMLAGCEKKEVLRQFSGPTMGTSYHVKIVPRGLSVPEDLTQQIDQKLATINAAMSTYIDDSELSLLNSATTSEWIPISQSLSTVLKESIALGELTSGALDVTVRPLVELWGFGVADQHDVIPTGDAVSQVMREIGFKKIELANNPDRLKKPVGVEIDLSSIAKGYAADEIGQLLFDAGFRDYLVEIGGEVVTRGKNQDNNVWLLGVETPNLGHVGVQQAIAVSGVGIATSGDYRNYFEQDGVRYSHLIDPNTGSPITNKVASVTVIAENCMRADGLATAFSILGAEKTLAIAEQEHIAVYMILKDDTGFKTVSSSAFKPYLREL